MNDLERWGELRKAVADMDGMDRETWPKHGNAPLAIASAYALKNTEIERLEKHNADLQEMVAARDRELEISHEEARRYYENYLDMMAERNVTQGELDAIHIEIERRKNERAEAFTRADIIEAYRHAGGGASSIVPIAASMADDLNQRRRAGGLTVTPARFQSSAPVVTDEDMEAYRVGVNSLRPDDELMSRAELTGYWDAIKAGLQNVVNRLAPRRSVTREEFERVIELAERHGDLWQDQPDSYWMARLTQEVGELASALVGDHDDSPEHEMEQVASIAMNWLRRRAAGITVEETNDG